MTVTDAQARSGSPSDVDVRTPSPFEALAEAYAERLSCLRRNASAAELAVNAQLIAALEQECLTSPLPDPGQLRGHRTSYHPDSALYLG